MNMMFAPVEAKQASVDLMILLRTRDLIREEKNWCQDFLSISDERGRGLRHCVFGALIRASKEQGRDSVDKRILEVMFKHCPSPLSPVGVNDKLGHAATMKMLDSTIREFM